MTSTKLPPEDTGGADDQGVVQVSLCVKFAGQLGYRVRTQRVSRVGLDVGGTFCAVKHVIGGVVHQTRARLAAGHSNAAHGQRVRLEGRGGLLLGDVHLVVSGGVEHKLSLRARHSVLNHGRVGYIQRLAVEFQYFPTCPFKFTAQFNSKLATAAKYDYLTLHSLAA